METVSKTLGLIIIGIFIILIVSVISGFPIMWLWNWLMPSIFGLTKINIWQAIGLGMLCNFLFKVVVNNNKK